MKTRSSLPLLILSCAASLALAAPAQRGPNGSCDGTCPGKPADSAAGVATSADTTPLTLSAAARSALLFQIDEERMARELYSAFGAKWDLRPFANIPQAEERHESVLRQLAVRAGLTAPTTVAGRFDSAEVQKRYDDLLKLGLESADAALRVGAYVEEVDIADLNTLVATTDSEALKAAAQALKTASGHHLSAFVSVLASRGITYAPQVLSAEDFKSLTMQAGGHRGLGQGRGQGRGWRGGTGSN